MGVILALPFLLLLVIFALSNRQTVEVGFWPLDYGLVVPLSVAVLVAMAAAFLVGGLIVWGSAVAQRRRARRAEADCRALRQEVNVLRDRLAIPVQAAPYASALPPPA